MQRIIRVIKMKNYSKIDYQYDSANRFLVAETNPAYLQVSYHYDGTGRLLDRILSNGAKTYYGWDTAERLTQLQNGIDTNTIR